MEDPVSPTKKHLVLLVEDNLDFAELLIDNIESLTDFKVRHFATAREALNYLEQAAPVVCGVLSDVIMRDMDGIQFLAEVRKAKGFADVPLIFISGTDPVVLASLISPYPFSGFIEKPVNFEKLIYQMEKSFSARAAALSRLA